jgi:Ca-activated chloride channel homolog
LGYKVKPKLFLTKKVHNVNGTLVRPPEAALGGGYVPLSLPQGWSSQGVFGRLPQTASGAPFYLLVGVMLLLLAWVIQPKFRVSA